MMRTVSYYIGKFLEIGSIVEITIISALQKPSPTQFWKFATAVTWLQEHGWILLLIAALTASIGRALTSYGKPWAWKAVKRALKNFRKFCFTKEVDGTELHFHRVTLFQRTWSLKASLMSPWTHGTFISPWAGWMVPVVREPDHVTMGTTIFLAPADPDRSEGVVGKVWQTQKVEFQELPELSSSSADDEIAEYARKGMVRVEWLKERVKKNKPISRSLCGFHIEVDDKFFGVVVIDSRQPNAINNNHRHWDVHVKLTAEFLSELLKKV